MHCTECRQYLCLKSGSTCWQDWHTKKSIGHKWLNFVYIYIYMDFCKKKSPLLFLIEFLIYFEDHIQDKKLFLFCFFYLPDSSSKPFLPSIDICDMCFLDSPIYLVFKNIYFYGSIICIFQVMRENVHAFWSCFCLMEEKIELDPYSEKLVKRVTPWPNKLAEKGEEIKKVQKSEGKRNTKESPRRDNLRS